jgi:hypothetical protein
VKRAAITLGIGLLVLSPLVRPATWDDFPISSYPMFSRRDLGGPQTIVHAEVRHADGRRTPATPSQVGSPEPMVAMLMLSNAAAGGRSAELCETVARNVGDPDAVAIEIARSEFDPAKYFRDNQRAPLSHVVIAECRVER